MSRYGKIESGFWQSRKVRRLSDDARYLMLYLLSCPHGNAVGCFVLHDGYVSADMGWEATRVETAFAELSQGGLAERDANTLLTRICGWWGHNSIENANVAKHVIKEIGLLPDCPVKDRLIADIRGRKDFHETVIETIAKGFQKGFQKPSRNQNLTLPSPTQPNPDGAADAPPSRDDEFQRFKAKYPTRGPASNPWKPAYDLFCRFVKQGIEPKWLIISADIYKQRCDDQKITGTEKVAQAKTWLHQERFRDYFDGIEAEAARREEQDAEMRARGFVWKDDKWQKEAA